MILCGLSVGLCFHGLSKRTLPSSSDLLCMVKMSTGYRNPTRYVCTLCSDCVVPWCLLLGSSCDCWWSICSLDVVTAALSGLVWSGLMAEDASMTHCNTEWPATSALEWPVHVHPDTLYSGTVQEVSSCTKMAAQNVMRTIRFPFFVVVVLCCPCLVSPLCTNSS